MGLKEEGQKIKVVSFGRKGEEKIKTCNKGIFINHFLMVFMERTRLKGNFYILLKYSNLYILILKIMR